MTFYEVLRMAPGALRRTELLKKLQEPDFGMTGVPVNNKWQQQMRLDRDLRYLVKKGKLMQIRHAAGKRGGRGQTYLVVPPSSLK